jgi:hypothetical protein
VWSELDVRLDKQPILVNTRGSAVVMHLFVGDDEADTAGAWPGKPVRATSNNAALRVGRQRSIGVEVIDARQSRPSL